MHFARNSNTSGKKSILIIFIISFLAIGIAILYGSIQARKAKADIEDGRAKIELVQDESGRTVLTDDLLRSDYNVYVKTSNRNLMIMTIVAVALFLSLVGWFIVTLVTFLVSLRVTCAYSREIVALWGSSGCLFSDESVPL